VTRIGSDAVAPYTRKRMGRVLVAVVLSVVAAGTAFAAGVRTPEEVRPRVDHHLRHVEELAQHFASVLTAACPRFATPAQWDRYLDGEVQRVVLLVAHVEQAWIEAKTTGDDDVRRVAKAPRKRLEQARALLDKLSTCADDNGSALNQLGLWRRIEREVPRRQVEIALPQ
jgi:hypothetical protein